MKLMCYRQDGEPAIGVVLDEGIINVSDVAADLPAALSP